MQRPRNVPQIGRGPQQFAKSSLPPIQSPMQMGQAGQFQSIPVQQIPVDDVSDLAMEIYARLVVGHLGRSIQPPDPILLKQLAQTARTSAQIYFQLDSEDNHE